MKNLTKNIAEPTFFAPEVEEILRMANKEKEAKFKYESDESVKNTQLKPKFVAIYYGWHGLPFE